MKTINKKDAAYKTIGEVAKALGLVNKETGHLQTHTIRYWVLRAWKFHIFPGSSKPHGAHPIVKRILSESENNTRLR